MRVLVAIATYRRPDGLATLLRSLEQASATRPFDILVVDNDEQGSAKAVAAASPLALRYVEEHRPGIAAARNRAMDDIDAYDAIVFVDDDEFVTPGWLDILVERAESSPAGVIIGPVTSTFPEGSPKWVVRGGFIQRPVLADAVAMTAGATNNTLMKVTAWRAAGAPRFDETFSATGGSDAKIFSILLSRGVRIEYASSAVVFEPVLPERMTLKWLVRRAYRNGIVSARIWLPKHGRIKTFLRGLIMAAEGVVKSLLHLVTLRGIQASSFNALITGLGVMSALTGIRVHEYKRSK